MTRRRPLPPLGAHAPPLQCNRMMGGTLEAPVGCGRPAAWHIIWTDDAENGIACDEHAEEARRRWSYVGLHAYDPTCSMPGAVWLPDEDRCVVDEGLLELEAAEAVAVPA